MLIHFTTSINKEIMQLKTCYHSVDVGLHFRVQHVGHLGTYSHVPRSKHDNNITISSTEKVCKNASTLIQWNAISVETDIQMIIKREDPLSSAKRRSWETPSSCF